MPRSASSLVRLFVPLAFLALPLTSSSAAHGYSNAVPVYFSSPAPVSTSVSVTTGRYADPIVKFTLGTAEPTADPYPDLSVRACLTALRGTVTLGCRGAVRRIGAYAIPLRDLTGVRLSPAMAFFGRLDLGITSRRLPPYDYGPTISSAGADIPVSLRLTR